MTRPFGQTFWLGFPFLKPTQGQRIIDERKSVRKSPVELSLDDLKRAHLLTRVVQKLDSVVSAHEKKPVEELVASELLAELRSARDIGNADVANAELESSLGKRVKYETDRQMLEWVDAFLDRITNKSVGLLQAVAVPASILTIFHDKIDKGISSVFVAVIFLIAFLLLLNLRVVVWSPKDAKIHPYADPSGELKLCLNLIRWRSGRLMVAIYLGLFCLLAGGFFFLFGLNKSLSVSV